MSCCTSTTSPDLPAELGAGAARACAAAGFEQLEVRCYDATERYQWYLPPGLRWFAPTYTRLAYAVGRPGLMGHLSFRATLPSGPA